MGLFSKAKPEPLPRVELHLNHQQERTFKPGDVVSGHVVIISPISITPDAVEVRFWGQSETWIRREDRSGTSNNKSSSYRHYRDRASLFNFGSNLFPSPYTLLPENKYEWPFQFQFPEATTFDRSACYEDPENGIWTPTSHYLPPSFITGNPETPPNCSITYGITATLRSASFKVDPEALSSTASLHFAPPSPSMSQPPQFSNHSKPFSIASLRLAGIAEPSLRQRLSERFSKDTPYMQLELACSLLNVASSGGSFDICTSMKVVHRSPNVAEIPPVSVTITKLQLLSFTLIRAPRDWKANTMRSGAPSKYHDGTPRRTGTKTQEMEVLEDKVVLNAVPESQTATLLISEAGKDKTADNEKCEVVFHGRIPGFTSPSFQSFAITCAYRIKVEVVAEVAGHKCKLAFEVMDVTIQAPPQLGSG